MRCTSILASICLAACHVPQTQSGSIDGGFTSHGDETGQTLIVSRHQISMIEGDTAGFELSLGADPNVSLAVLIQSSDPIAFPVSPQTVVFTSADYSKPIHITVSSLVDVDVFDRTGDIHLSALSHEETVAVVATDLTRYQDFGASSAFSGTTSIARGRLICSTVQIDHAGELASFGLFVPGGSGSFRMALYSDKPGRPDKLLGSMPLLASLTDGVNHGVAPPGVSVDVGTAWVCVVFGPVASGNFTPLGTAVGNANGRLCTDPFPMVPANLFPDVGSDISDCADSPSVNLWISSFAQGPRP